MKTQRRWMKSVLATSTEKQPALPFARGQRKHKPILALTRGTPRKAG
ncbi:MAG: hypothetical protein ACK4RN_00515 [Pseudorhodobacter sp.]